MSLSKQQRYINQKYKDSVVLPCSITKEHRIKGTINDSRLLFNCRFSQNDIIDREIFIDYTVTVKFSTTNYPIKLAFSEYCLAQNPIQRIITDFNIILNNSQKVSYNPSLLTNPLTFYSEKELDLLEIPSPINNSLAEGKNIIVFPNPRNDSMLAESHFRSYSVSKGDKTKHRGMYIPTSVVVAGNDATITYNIQERLKHPILQGPDYSCLAQITNMDVDLKLGNLLGMFQISRVFGYDGTNTEFIDPINVQINLSSDIYLIVRSYVPNTIINRSIEFPYMQYKLLTFNAGTLNVYDPSTDNSKKLTTGFINTREIILGLVPSRMYIFLQSKTIKDELTNDAYCCIQKISISTQNESNALANSTVKQLHQMSVRNGSRQDFIGFSDFQGSIVCVDFKNSDISSFIPNASQYFQFQIEVTFINTTYSDFTEDNIRSAEVRAQKDYNLHILLENDGKIVCHNYNTITNEYGISKHIIAKLM